MAQGYVPLNQEDLKSPSGLVELNRMLRLLFDLLPNQLTTGEGFRIISGYGSPESAQKASVGSIYLRLDGAGTTTLYVKETGTGDTGWIAK